MQGIKVYNPRLVEFVRPLTHWRILSLEHIKSLTQNYDHRITFQRHFLTLEKLGFVKSFRNPWNRVKFIYLTLDGARALEEYEKTRTIDESIIIHESKVSELTFEIAKLDCMRSADVFADNNAEHFLKSKDTRHDANFIYESKEKEFRIGIEVEITRKSKKRIRSRFNDIFNGSYYNNVIYFFSHKKTMDFYYELYINEFDEGVSYPKIIFLNCEDYVQKKIKLESFSGYYGRKETSFLEFFDVTLSEHRATYA